MAITLQQVRDPLHVCTANSLSPMALQYT